jgi:plastocyanin
VTTSPALRTRRLRHVAAALVLATALAACGDDGSSADSDAGSTVDSNVDTTVDSGDDAGAPEVVMELVAFTPERLEVEAGTTVTWQQRDPGFHTVTSGTVEQGGAGVIQMPDATFDSGRVTTDDTFQHTFDEPGTYPYFCSLHPATMRGEVLVT